MYLLLDTSTPTCKVTLVDEAGSYSYEWLAERQLAQGLLKFLVEKVHEHDTQLSELEGIAALRGPGSFTGLRIGISTLNTLAAFKSIPIVGATGDDWQEQALRKLRAGRNDKIILPEYGRPARITQPRK